MLPIAVYERLYRAALESPGGTFVEIGTAGGAATIALALGARAAGKRFHIYTADPFDLGSRLSIGSVAHNLALVRAGFDAFGVADDITIVAGESSDLLKRLRDKASILLIDADGRIDRDIALLYARLTPSAQIVIDDIDDRVYARPDGAGWRVDQKHRLSHLLTRIFLDMNLLVEVEIVAQTGFYRKGSASVPPAEILAAGFDAYSELVVARIEPGQIGFRSALRRLLEKNLPGALRRYRAMRHRRSR